MFLRITASADTYITNKIINGAFSASDANVGQAGTVDLFRLYDETTLQSVSTTNELSRALIKFNYDQIESLWNDGKIDIAHSSFSCKLKMFDVMGGNVTPTNFTLSLFPLAQEFDEGYGRDVAAFRDIDAANFITASKNGSTVNTWYASGANAQGNLGDPNIDIYVSGNVGNGLESLNVSQLFANGSENLEMDITKLVSASIKGDLTNYGFRLSFTGSQEEDTVTRFVKRFGSRHSLNRNLRPIIEISFDDSIIDNHNDFYFNLSGSLFLNNFERGKLANIKSGSALTPVSGINSILLTLKTGSFSFTTTGSQHSLAGAGNVFDTGVYSASFAIDTFGSSSVNPYDTLEDFIRVSGSVTFDEIWGSLDGTVGYVTSSVTIKSPQFYAFNQDPRDLTVKLTNLKDSYRQNDVSRVRAFVIDQNAQPRSAKRQLYRKSALIDEAYYRIRDAISGDIVLPFLRSNNGTRLSVDSEGPYFDLRFNSLFTGRTYRIDVLVIDGDVEKIHTPDSVFRVDD
jgi:hypothetical protein